MISVVISMLILIFLTIGVVVFWPNHDRGGTWRCGFSRAIGWGFLRHGPMLLMFFMMSKGASGDVQTRPFGVFTTSVATGPVIPRQGAPQQCLLLFRRKVMIWVGGSWVG